MWFAKATTFCFNNTCKSCNHLKFRVDHLSEKTRFSGLARTSMQTSNIMICWRRDQWSLSLSTSIQCCYSISYHEELIICILTLFRRLDSATMDNDNIVGITLVHRLSLVQDKYTTYETCSDSDWIQRSIIEEDLKLINIGKHNQEMFGTAVVLRSGQKQNGKAEPALIHARNLGGIVAWQKCYVT